MGLLRPPALGYNQRPPGLSQRRIYLMRPVSHHRAAAQHELVGRCRRRGREQLGSTAASHLYKIIFFSQGKVYEIYARSISQGSLFGFIEVEELVFGERTSVVVDPSEEKLKSEFESVKRTYIPMHAVVRIDEVDKQGVSKISSVDGDNVTPFPMPVYTPGGSDSS